MLYSEKVTLMNLFKDGDYVALRYLTARLGVTMTGIEAWICEGDAIPLIYYEEHDDQIDADRWSDETAIFTADNEYADPTQFKEGDILMLAEMPFDKYGHRATGYAIWQKAAAGNYCWQNEYED